MVTPNKDDDYLDRLRDYYAENRRIPSMQRIAELMQFASKTASRKLLERLAAAGFVQRPGRRCLDSRRALLRAAAGGRDGVCRLPGPDRRRRCRSASLIDIPSCAIPRAR